MSEVSNLFWICCKWPNIDLWCTESTDIRKWQAQKGSPFTPLLQITNHIAGVMRNGRMNVPQDTPVGNVTVCLQKEQKQRLKVILIKNISYNKSKFSDFDLFKYHYSCLLPSIKFWELQLVYFFRRDIGQPIHPTRQVLFPCHLPGDKFCQKYLSDPKKA